jgi:hypothetical protein
VEGAGRRENGPSLLDVGRDALQSWWADPAVKAWDPVARLAGWRAAGEGTTVARRPHAFRAAIGVHVGGLPNPRTGRGDAAADPERVGGELAELVLDLVDDAFAAIRDRGRGLVGEPCVLAQALGDLGELLGA